MNEATEAGDGRGIGRSALDMERQARNKKLEARSRLSIGVGCPSLSAATACKYAADLNYSFGAMSSIRNKVKYEESVQKIEEISLCIKRAAQNAPGTSAVHSELIEQSNEISFLLSSIRATNLQNENAIQHLQRQLVELTNERDAARKDVRRLEKAGARREREWEDRLNRERRGFSASTHSQQKEILKLKRKVNMWGKRCRQAECELKGAKFEKARGSSENEEPSTTVSDPAICSSDVPLETITFFEEEQSIIGISNSQWPDCMNRCNAAFISGQVQGDRLSILTEDQSNTATTATESSSGSSGGTGNDENEIPEIEQFHRRLRHWNRKRIVENNPDTTIASSGDMKEAQNDDVDGEPGRNLSPLSKLHAENPELLALLKDIIESASAMCRKMRVFVKQHQASVQDYEAKLTVFKNELNQAALIKKELSASLLSLKEENEVLGAALGESNATEEFYEQMLIGTNEEKEKARQDRKAANLERDMAYDACNALQLEVDLLRKMKNGSEGDGKVVVDRRCLAVKNQRTEANSRQ